MNDLKSRYERMMCDLANQENARRSKSFRIVNQQRQLTGGPRFEAALRRDRASGRAWMVVQVFFAVCAIVATIVLTAL